MVHIKGTSTNKVMIIDDDIINSTALAQRLERRNFKVKLITDATLALEILEKEPVDIVLLDIVMPEIDGISLLKKIRFKYASDDLPVIMVTAVHDSADIFDAFDSGANDYITKPVNVDAAVARINGQIGLVELRKKKDTENLAAIIATYHHEINNPLAIAKSELQFLSHDMEKTLQESIIRITQALDRISTILTKIQSISAEIKIPFQFLANNTKLIKLRKE